MNLRKYQDALMSLEQLHWHLHLNGGPDMWTAELLRQFEAAVNDNSDKERVEWTKQQPQSAA